MKPGKLWQFVSKAEKAQKSITKRLSQKQPSPDQSSNQFLQTSIMQENYTTHANECSSIFVSHRVKDEPAVTSIFKPLQTSRELSANLQFEFMGVKLHVSTQREDMNRQSFAELVGQIEEIKGSRLTQRGKEKVLFLLASRLNSMRDSEKSQVSTRKNSILSKGQDCWIKNKQNCENGTGKKDGIAAKAMKKNGLQYTSKAMANSNR